MALLTAIAMGGERVGTCLHVVFHYNIHVCRQELLPR